MDVIDMVLGLADDPGLELLNTRPVPAPAAEPLELLGDGGALLTWLGRVGFLDDSELTLVQGQFDSDQLDDVAAEARNLRERLRVATGTWAEAPGDLDPALLEELNVVLATDHRFGRLSASGDDGFALQDVRQWTSPGQLLAPPVEAWGRLIAEGDPVLVRRCEGCVIWFRDRTKAHRRRWCSMAMCGNREKARRHRARQSDHLEK